MLVSRSPKPIPSPRQRRLLQALIAPEMRVIASWPWHFVTNCQGWIAHDIQPTDADIAPMVRNGWLIEHHGIWTEWLITEDGRKAARR